jgi:hypothetical protein
LKYLEADKVRKFRKDNDMVRKFTVLIGLTMSLLVAREASAIPVAATDLDAWLPGAGPLFAGPLADVFTVADAPPPTMGTILNNVYYDGTQYTYVHTVNPSLNNNAFLNTAFDVSGFTGVAGWDFSQSDAVGGNGAGDFFINYTGQLSWLALFGPALGWDANEPISFFFVSTRPPIIGDYNLIGLESGTAQSYAPVPEPGSIALLGSGLVGVYAAVRRRRSLKA